MFKTWRDSYWKRWLERHDTEFRSGVSQLGRNKRLIVEAPARIGEADFKLRDQELHIGAFAVLRKTLFHRVSHIGRYVTTGQDSRVGLGARAHPLDWLSTNSVQYEPGFFDRFDAPRLRYESVGDSDTWIGNDVFIGEGAAVLSGVKVHDGAVVAAMSVVTRDVPPYAIVAGSPAKIVRYRFAPDICERLQASRWWDLAPQQVAALPMNRIEDALERIEALRASGEAQDALFPRVEIRRQGCRVLAGG
ncbi:MULTISPECIES: CatB-related O-acetyltransferase [unclassified Pseudomonas]|uniref:CatB-related O-acetyltransferase n=1 Tax=unclassified Pseudomonas TaxID=196821 RepID=UPI0002A29F39|nr:MULTISPECIES: CatB-related O-acetyltransferase [unclassified Pseudomonas]MBB1609052.1 hypothetical protein [Pseudomonas sp. UMC76]MBB1637055.1 hypothetical protein [Pseudomonas sp. UME83]NTX92983.1 CatB-related O-acetyltransferase [Pseudomonas sp. UMA643]NTY22063.1 CatB-related O-acetyltransferase [Pseudomonas sp. UMC3103]NTY28272.1 CatB-related O-acetyltransferase [Pseudomonas sp. UMA603]